MTEHITAIQAVALAGITYRQLDYWTTQGYIRPRRNIGANPGSGRQRQYTEREARILCTMAALVDDGLDPKSAALVARRLEMHGTAYLGGLTLTSAGAA